MSTTAVDVQIFGRSLKLNCPSEQVSALNRAAEDLNKRLHELKAKTQVTNTEQLIITAALNISYELTQEREKNQDYANSIEDRIQLLQKTIEQALLEQTNKNNAS